MSQTAVHSNAFNFLSFLQNSVDPRTGQYTLAISLPELVGNYLIGPSLPLRLAFNPLNVQDSGFGKGWDLALTQYVVSTRALSLHTGESFTVDGSGPQPRISEKKIDSFHFHDDGDNQYRVVHRSGLIEVLSPFGPTNAKVCLPTRVFAPSGHWLDLTYDAHPQFPQSWCLTRITDGTGLVLLTLDYSNNTRVRLDLHPDHGSTPGTPRARYELRFTGREVREIVLPTEEQASWRFEYRTVQNMTCISKVQTPTGAEEVVGYGERGDLGHRLPGTDRYLPRVTSHVVKPGFGQPDMETRYRYTEGNFVGNASGITWRDDGADNLYRAQPDYRYGSTLEHHEGGVAVRTVTQSYNRHHLMQLQTTEQDGHIEEIETLYHEVDGASFEAQPSYFQLPKRTTRRWSFQDNVREEVEDTDYDGFGNLIEQVQATGVKTTFAFYPAAGESGSCPPDPHGFVSHQKSKTVWPDTSGEEGAAVLRTLYRYKELPVIAVPDVTSTQGPAAYWVLPWDEQLVEVNGQQETLLRVTSQKHVSDPSDVLGYGRLCETCTTLDHKDTLIEYAYSREPDNPDPVLVTTQTITGFDHDVELPDGSRRHARKVITLKQSMLIDEPLLNRDDNDVEIEYQYDALARVIRETVAPNDPQYVASRHYSYVLTSSPGQQALQTMTDVKGVTTRTQLDGLQRVVAQQRQDADNLSPAARAEFREIYAARFDALGNLVEEISHDWLEDDQLRLRRTFEYDAWGQQRCETGPDGVKQFEVTNPIGTAASKWLPIKESWRESADGSSRTGITVTWLNLFEEPAQIERFDVLGRSISVQRFYHDGLGRLAREIDARQAVTDYRYDCFDRLLTKTLPDTAVVTRAYAIHSAEDLPVSIDVDGTVLGEQQFDGLDRLVLATTGGRKRVSSYAPGQRQPSHVITPSGQQIDYEYRPALGEEPVLRRVQQVTGDYEYDSQNARLIYCREQGVELRRDYFSTGELKTETLSHDGVPYCMSYVSSLQGLQLRYTDVLGQTQEYRYDEAGRLHRTWLAEVSATFQYDDLGRTSSILTEADGQWLLTELEYDDFEREILRRFITEDSLQVLEQDYDEADAIISKTLSDGEGGILRAESFEYDERARLVYYGCEGELSPVDPYGKVIVSQMFEFDALDNITLVVTHFPGESGMERDYAEYQFDNEDPSQLSAITHTHADYPASIPLYYDKDGNLIQDEQERILDYDGLGRLQSVAQPPGTTLATYGYDPLDRLSSQGT
ncbi:RHS repeat domain-containing protein [Pseudomonas sp. NPDC089396]|uniref:RHS repeat domain-containing protein n=1 Tax=Pseudomonas sp. NPDC089396 TaxID=3364461 RepID=UPI003837CE89